MRLPLRLTVLLYVGLLVAAPVGAILWRALSPGLGAAWSSISGPDAVHALGLTLLSVVLVVPANAGFGLLAALLVARRGGWPLRVLMALVDLPLALSPVVVGLALLLVYGDSGWAGSWLAQRGVELVFAWPGIAIACAFVSLPYVARELVPLLAALGTAPEDAARTLGAGPAQVFWRITLPSLRVALAYGVGLTAARVLGEIGAVTVVSGDIEGHTQTMTLFIQQQYQNFQPQAAFAGAVVLGLLSLTIFGGLSIFGRRAELAA